MKACVVIPTRNDKSILRAVGSVFAQKHEDWTCVVIGQADISKLAGDPRLIYQPHEGTVAEMMEVGLRYAMGHADFWVPLRSQDWFQVYKLTFDALALQTEGAAFGPFMRIKDQTMKTGDPIAVGNTPIFDANRFLIRGIPVVSWGNCAVRTEVLRKLPALFTPAIQEYGAFLLNARIAHATRWAWRGEVGETLYVAPEPDEFVSLWSGRMTVDATVLEDLPESEPQRQADYLASCRVLLG